MKRVLLLLTSSYLVSCLPPPHPAVIDVKKEEQHLPSYLRSPALNNPLLRHILSLSSLLHEGEKLVGHRDTDDIDRRQVYNLLTHAGLIPRRHNHQQSHEPIRFPGNPTFSHQDFFEPPAFISPEILQHL